MSLALIALVGFQFYWIKGAVDENEASFEKEVREALNAVALQLEKQEAFSTIYPTINPTMGLAQPPTPQTSQEQLLFSFQFEINDGRGNNQVIQFQNQPPQDWSDGSRTITAQEEIDRLIQENQRRQDYPGNRFRWCGLRDEPSFAPYVLRFVSRNAQPV